MARFRFDEPAGDVAEQSHDVTVKELKEIKIARHYSVDGLGLRLWIVKTSLHVLRLDSGARPT